MVKTAHIHKITIQRFRGIHSLQWMPAAGMNVILGGGGDQASLDEVEMK